MNINELAKQVNYDIPLGMEKSLIAREIGFRFKDNRYLKILSDRAFILGYLNSRIYFKYENGSFKECTNGAIA